MWVGLASIVLSLASGCSRGQSDRSSTSAAFSATDTLPNGVPVALASTSVQWVAMWRKVAPGFTADSLAREGRSPAGFGSGVRPLEHCIVSGADSSVLCDVLGETSPTGRYGLVENAYRTTPDPGVPNSAGGEPDAAAILIDYGRRTCDMFLVLGTPYTFDWGAWVDSTHFALAGSESDEESTCFGFVRLYSIEENSVTTWTTHAVRLALRVPYLAASDDRIMARCRAWKRARSRP